MADIRANIYLRKGGKASTGGRFSVTLYFRCPPQKSVPEVGGPSTEGYCFVSGDVVKSSVRACM